MIVAHRGYAFKHPQNTLEACQAAVDAGARWVEVDVQLRGGVPVLAHDPDPSSEEQTLAEFADWLVDSGVSALVDFKSESLNEYGRTVVVRSVMDVMRGTWHPISFDHQALEIAVDLGSRSPGWVVCDAGPETLAAAYRLGPRWMIINQIFMPAALPSGPWEWMVYEIENKAQAENALRKGAKWLETMRVAELIEELKWHS